MMENVTLTPREQTRLQVLNSLLAAHMTLDQAATVMGVNPRHARRMLAAYRDEGSSALAHGLSGQRPHNATAETTRDTMLRLARTRYAGTNHIHLSELLSEREGIDIAKTALRRILVNAGLSSPRRRRPPKHRGAASGCPGRVCWSSWTAVFILGWETIGRSSRCRSPWMMPPAVW